MDDEERPLDPTKDWVREHLHRYVATDGANGHEWRGALTLLLTTRGRRSGNLRRTPLIYGRSGRTTWWSGRRRQAAAPGVVPQPRRRSGGDRAGDGRRDARPRPGGGGRGVAAPVGLMAGSGRPTTTTRRARRGRSRSWSSRRRGASRRRAGARTSSIRIARADPAEPGARHCLDAYAAELDRRFGAGGFDPARSIPATDDEPAPGRLPAGRDDGRQPRRLHGAGSTATSRPR